MGLRDRFKKRVAKAIGRDSPTKEATTRPAPKPPPPNKRPRASYRTHSAESDAPAPAPTLPTETVQAVAPEIGLPQAEPLQVALPDSESPQAEQPQAEQPQAEPPQAEPQQAEQPQAEQPQAEPPKAEPKKPEPHADAQEEIRPQQTLDSSPNPSAAESPAPLPADEVPMDKREIDTEITYTVRLFNKAEGLDTEIQVFEGEFVLDAADRCAVDLPSSCRNGGCTVCAGRLISGTMEMEDQYVLEEEHIEDGFQLLCCGVLTSDAVIETHQDEVVS